MKNYFKKIISALILAFVASFMIYIYEPIIMYSSNISDFWFDIYSMFSCTWIPALIMFAIIFAGYNIIYFIENKIVKKQKNIYNISLLIGFILFIVTYIQGNYLAGNLPVLDGTPIEWENYTTQTIISIILLVVITGLTIFGTKKFKYEKTIKVLNGVTLGIFVMLSVSLISTSISVEECFNQKGYTSTTTAEHINEYSSKNNFIILLLDAIDSETMDKVIKDNEEFEHVLDDFTYYPDTVGGYPFTRDSIPLILSGVWSENKTDFSTFYNNAMDQSKLLELLKEEKYDINIYDEDLYFTTENARVIKNLSFDNKVDKYKFIKEETKYSLFKYLPFYLKRFSKIEKLDFNETRKANDDVEDVFRWEDETFYNDYIEKTIKIGDDKQFKFIHLEGAHYPLNLDKNFNEIENGTIEDKMGTSMTLVDKYLKLLKDNNIYDNSTIILMADHGFWWETDDDSLLKRQNPMFYIKGFNEKHEKMNVSDEKVSYGYLQDIYKELLNGKQTKDLFENIDNSGPRRFLLYRISGYDHMIEYMQNGHSKDLDTLEETGNIFDR